MEVVGVVGHIRHDGLDVDPRPQVYFNYLQRAQDRMALVVRGSAERAALTAAVVQRFAKSIPSSRSTTSGRWTRWWSDRRRNAG